MNRKKRPPQCEPGSMEGNTKEMAARLRLSRERLMASELTSTARAWRLWGACIEATAGYTRAADQTYTVTLAESAQIKRQVASALLRRFAELGVFEWEEPVHTGSREARILELPRLTRLEGTQSGATNIRSGTQSGTTCGPEVPRVGPRTYVQVPRVGPLHSYTPSAEILSQDPEPRPRPSSIETEDFDSLTGGHGGLEGGTPKSGEPETGPEPDAFVRGLTIEELHQGVASYGSTIAGLYAEELERRNVAPRRRPAWLDYTEGNDA